MRFWDASAIVPLVVEEGASAAMRALLRQDDELAVWWGAGLECASALARRARAGDLTRADAARADQRLRRAAEGWLEVPATDAVRTAARRLLGVHALRAADALQLAAAIIAADREPASIDFVTLDDRLAEAAEREGFRVLGT